MTQIVCTYCGIAYPDEGGLVIDDRYFHSIRCYLAWKDEQNIVKTFPPDPRYFNETYQDELPWDAIEGTFGGGEM